MSASDKGSTFKEFKPVRFWDGVKGPFVRKSGATEMKRSHPSFGGPSPSDNSERSEK